MTDSGLVISRLVRHMVTHLDAFTGKRNTRHHYLEFRKAKKALYRMRPDIAAQLVSFAVQKTHWAHGVNRGKRRKRR